MRGKYADRRVTTPILWLHGLKDPFFTPGMFKDITEHADDVRIEYLPDGAHFPAEECPQDVAEHLRAVLLIRRSHCAKNMIAARVRRAAGHPAQ